MKEWKKKAAYIFGHHTTSVTIGVHFSFPANNWQVGCRVGYFRDLLMWISFLQDNIANKKTRMLF